MPSSSVLFRRNLSNSFLRYPYTSCKFSSFQLTTVTPITIVSDCTQVSPYLALIAQNLNHCTQYDFPLYAPVLSRYNESRGS